MNTHSVLTLGSRFILIVALTASLPVHAGDPISPPSKAAVPATTTPNLMKLPLRFERSQTETASEVQFTARGLGYSLFLTPKEIVLVLAKGSENSQSGLPRHGPRHRLGADAPEGRESSVVRMKMVGANSTPRLTGRDELPSKSHYFIGNDPSRWRKNVPNYAKVEYQNIYPGVDLVFYGNQRQVEFDFIVSPGTDTDQIQMEVEGAKCLRLDAGNLVIETGTGDLILQKPQLFQVIDNKRVEVPGNFVLEGEQSIRFAVGDFDAGRPLVIDPILSYSTYFGGTDFDSAVGIALDPDNNICIAGQTRSPNFIPTPLGSGVTGGIFITKLRPDGSAPIFSVYLAGSIVGPTDSAFFGGDEVTGIAIDPQGNILISGTTSSTSFPVKDAIQPTKNREDQYKAGSDGFVTKIKAAGDDLIYSTYLGGNAIDTAKGIAVDAAANAYVTGSTTSTNFPTSPDALTTTIHGPLSPAPVVAPKPLAGYADAFITKLSPSGALLYSTYFGGSYFDNGNAIAVDGSEGIYVAGSTQSADLQPTDTAYQKEFRAPQDGFLLKLDSTGRQIRYLTYFGGNSGLEVTPRVLGFGLSGPSDQNVNGSLKLRNPGSRTVTITFFDTSSGLRRITFPDMPAVPFNLAPGEELTLTVAGTASSVGVGSYRLVAQIEGVGKQGKRDVFFNIIGRTPSESDQAEPIAAQSTFEGPSAIALDPTGNIFIAGSFDSFDFPSQGLQLPLVEKQTFGGSAFAAKFDATPTLQYSVILGGSKSDQASGIAVDPMGNAYVVGSTSSEEFPLVDPLQSTLGGTAGQFGFPTDVFLTKLSPTGDRILFSTLLGGAEADFGRAVALDRDGNASIAGSTYSTDFPVTPNALQSTFASLPKIDFFGFPFTVPDAFVAMISQGQTPQEIQLWQKIEIAAPTQATDGPASFKVEFVRMVSGSEIRAQAEALTVKSNAVTVRVPPALLGPTDVSAPPVGTDRNVHVEVIRVATAQEIAREPLVLRFPQPIIVDELDVRQSSPGLRTVSQFVFGAPSPNIHTFSFLGRSSDGLVGLRVLNTDLRFPVPLRFETDDVVVLEPEPGSGRLKLLGTPFHIPNLGPGNQGLQFNVSQNGVYVFAIEANTNSPGPFPARYQFHLAGNVGLPRKLTNGAPEHPRGTRLDTLFNHPAPRAQGLFPGDIGVARTALFKFANAASISQFARAVLVPPAIGFTNGMRIVRSADPTTPLELTTPTARTPDCAAPVVGTVIDFTQIPDPASVLDPSPVLSESLCAVLGQNDGNGLTLPKTLPGAAGTISSLILDMGSGTEIVDGTGADFEVLAAAGTYSVRVGNSPYAESFSAIPGTFTGVQQLDLATVGLKSARYVWIFAAPGVVLDAVRSLNVFADEISPSIGAITHVTSATITVRRAKDAGNLLDPFLQLIAPNGDLFDENEAGFGDDLSPDFSDAALINRVLPQDGFYRYLVKGYDKQPDNQSSGTFFTRLETSGNYDPVELVVSSASEEQTIAQKTGAISATRQRDSYLFQASPGTSLNIVVNATGNLATLNPVVELHDPEDFLIAANDDYPGRVRNAALSVTLPALTVGGAALSSPSTYRVVVSAIDGFGSTSPLSAGTAHIRQAVSGNYELKVFTGALTGIPPGGVPRIDSINPASGLAGAQVTLSGANFSATVSSNIVLFGSAQATVVTASSNQLVVVVPPGLPAGPASVTVTVGGQTSAPASFQTSVPVARTAASRLNCLSLRFLPAIVRFGGQDYRLELTSLADTSPPNGELYPLFDPFDYSHAGSLLLRALNSPDTIGGGIFLDVAMASDVDRDGVADFFQVSQGVGSTQTTGDYFTDIDDGTVIATWSRVAGSKTGTCRLALLSLDLGQLPEFTNTFELLEYTGSLTYTPASNNLTGAVQFAQTQSSSNTLTGPIQLTRSPTNRLNELQYSSGRWTNAIGGTLSYFSGVLQRVLASSSNYFGGLQFADGDLATTDADYYDWVLSVRDQNDVDGDGVPDLSDDPGDGLPPVAFTGVRLESGQIVLEWRGTGRLQSASEVVGPWDEIIGASSPFRHTPVGPRQYFRIAP